MDEYKPLELEKFVTDLKEYRKNHTVWYGMEMEDVRHCALTLFLGYEQIHGVAGFVYQQTYSKELEYRILQSLRERAFSLMQEFSGYDLRVEDRQDAMGERLITLSCRRGRDRLVELSLDIRKSCYDNFYVSLSYPISYGVALVGEDSKSNRRRAVLNSVVEDLVVGASI